MPETPDPQHREYSEVRLRAYRALFGGDPVEVCSSTELSGDRAIDILGFQIELAGEAQLVVVTNGMSDVRMVEDGVRSRRVELIQYLPRLTYGHAKRLYDMAWLPHFDEFCLGVGDTVQWEHAAVEGTPWTDAMFLEPILRSHREFTVEIGGEAVHLLWHIPLTRAELEFKIAHGRDALIDRMLQVELPIVFDESDRPNLVEST